jgi:large subunit ribosomal protein L27e
MCRCEQNYKQAVQGAIVKPFIKAVNYSHLFITRYALELECWKGIVSFDTFSEPTQCEDAKKTIRSDNQTSHQGR